MKLRMKLTAGMLAAAMIVSSMGFSTGSIQTEAAARETGDIVIQDHQTDIISDETDDVLDTEKSKNGQSTSKNIIVSPKQEHEPPKDIYIVELDLQGRGAMDSIKVTADEKINRPEDPTAADYAFTGWFKEAECKNEWDFDADTVTIKSKGNFKGKRTIPFTITKDPEQISEMLYQTIEKGCKNQVGIQFDPVKNVVNSGDYIDISAFGLSNNSEEDTAFVYQTYRKVYYDHPEL